MPSRTPRADISTTPAWDCHQCPHRHNPTAPCPPTSTWLTLALCRHCNPRTRRYCNSHRNPGWGR